MPDLAPNPIPLRLASGDVFSALRSALLAARFTEAAICERLHLQKISQFQFTPEHRPPPRPLAQNPDPLDILIRLFLENQPVPRDTARALPLELFSALGLTVPHAADPSLLSGTVMLHPLRDLYIVSDRPTPLEGNQHRPPDDFVYPAMIPNTALFLDLIPPGPCDAFLDLCAGTGIAALVAARDGAAHAYSYDITERSTVFAEFNRRLNAVANFTAAQGDLYEPAGDLTFDRIVAHPPYVPVYRPQLIFDSGGQDGEQIVRRIIEGLPRHLRPGGRFYGLTMGSDRSLPFEQRLREWLGPAAKEFDVAFVQRITRTPREWAAESVIAKKGPVSDIADWRAFFENLHVQALVYGFLMIQRRAQPRPGFTVRRQTGPRTGPAEHAWLFDWETAVVSHELTSHESTPHESTWILDLRPRSVPGIRLRVDHSLENGEWIPGAFLLETDY
ncbi:MAG: class I SAM-dependent methyltransferase, partial [Acidobacteriota bacterium]|nr:class I SAM-dependent methyltransferase [Acidobacteriota bacterium]